MFRIFVSFTLFMLISCGDKKDTTTQAGQPTHFHMEDRGPEIQVTANAEGVKINAKPAGLNVVAKPGHVVPVVAEEDIVRHIPPQADNSQVLRYGNEPVNQGVANNALAGLAFRGSKLKQTLNNAPIQVNTISDNLPAPSVSQLQGNDIAGNGMQAMPETTGLGSDLLNNQVQGNGLLGNQVQGNGLLNNQLLGNGLMGNQFLGNGLIGNPFLGNGLTGNRMRLGGMFGRRRRRKQKSINNFYYPEITWNGKYSDDDEDDDDYDYDDYKRNKVVKDDKNK